MKFLHSADLHIGRFLDGRPRWDEQAAVLNEIIDIADQQQVDLVLLAGDVFDSFIPAAQSEELFYDFIERLSSDGARAVVVIAGNHDQPQRLAAASVLAAYRSVYLIGLPGQSFHATTKDQKQRQVYVEQDGQALHLRLANGERAVIAALPYVSESRIKDVFSAQLHDENETSREYSAVLSDYLQQLTDEFEPGAAAVIVAHLFVKGASVSDSERPLSVQVGGSFGIDAGIFPKNADYIALGHLHRPQKLESLNCCCYAGSPLAYSFSEADQTKSVVVGEIDCSMADHVVSWHRVPLASGKPLTRWYCNGYQEALVRCRDKSLHNMWVQLQIELEQPLSMEQIDELRQSHPGLIVIDPVYKKEKEAQIMAEAEADLSILDKFALFVQENEGSPADDELLQAFVSLLEESDDEDGELK